MDLDNDDPKLLNAVVKFMYGIDYTVPAGLDAAVFHADLYSYAEYYQLPSLKQSKLFSHVTMTPPSACGPKQNHLFG